MLENFKNKVIKKLGGYTFQDVLLNSQKQMIVTKKENSIVTITGSLKCPAECTSNNALLKESVERVIRGPITDYIIQHGPYILKVEKNKGGLYPNTANVIVKIKMVKNEEGW